MSLRVFHIFFVTVSILLAFGFAGLELYDFARQGGILEAVLGAGSLIAGMALLVYLRAVIKKLKNLDSP